MPHFRSRGPKLLRTIVQRWISSCPVGQKKQLQYSKTRIDRAGVTLRQFLAGEPLGHDEILEAAAIVDHWRGCHAYPLNKAAAGLRSMVKTAGADPADIAQRLKRFVTIVDKLERHRV